jgi:hypothetical protein
VGAKVAFSGRVSLRVDINRVVRTCLHAGLTADAAGVIKVDDPIEPLEKSLGRADLDAWRVFAVVAAKDRKEPSSIGKFPLFNVFDPGAVDAEWNLILLFAGHGAGVATNASLLINN